MHPDANPNYPSVSFTVPASNTSQTMSIGDWIVTMLISCIPFIGIIMLFVWAFGSTTPPSKANWAKATLIFFLIFAVLGMLFAGSLIAMLASMGGHGSRM